MFQIIICSNNSPFLFLLKPQNTRSCISCLYLLISKSKMASILLPRVMTLTLNVWLILVQLLNVVCYGGYWGWWTPWPQNRHVTWPPEICAASVLSSFLQVIFNPKPCVPPTHHIMTSRNMNNFCPLVLSSGSNFRISWFLIPVGVKKIHF